MKTSSVIKNVFNKFLYLLNFFGKNEVFCILLIFYMIILFFGTLCQKEMGLQFAQDHYFSSNFLFIMDKIPFFGGKLILSFIFVSLVIRIIKDKWRKKKIGVILIHIGILILLIGAYVSNKYGEDGYLIINEGEYVNSFHRNDLYELLIENKENNKTFSFFLDRNDLIKDIKINKSIILKIFHLHTNCRFSYKNRFLKRNLSDKINRFFDVIDYPNFVEQENNIVSLKLNLSHIKSNYNFFILSNNSINNYFFYEDNFLKISLLKKKEKLPFNLYLIKFTKILHPGTNNAKAYKSELLVNGINNLKWKQNIEMNKPFRYLGYTFYQTSFLENSNINSTVLTVVKNSGSLFPYISILVIFFGFVIHIIIFYKRFFRY